MTCFPTPLRSASAALARLVHGAIAVGLLAACAGATAAPLLVDGSQSVLDLWPGMTMLSETDSQPLTIEQAQEAAARFAAPRWASATLGVRRQSVWLRVELVDAQPAQPGPAGDSAPRPYHPWIIDVQYPPLQHVDLYLVAGGRVIQEARLGSSLPLAQRPLAGRTHAEVLRLLAGQRHELYLRIQTAGAMVVPVTLSQPHAFHTSSINEQMLQGVLCGVALCLLLYSLTQWVNLREPLFAKYALVVGGSLMFSMYQFGLGMQYLWTDSPWIERHAPGLFSLLVTSGTFLFVEQVLATPGTAQRFGRLMKSGAALTGVFAVAHAMDVINTATVVAVVSLIGPLPLMAGIPGAIARARRRDPVGLCFLTAWAVSFCCMATMIGVLNGRMPANFWTLHAFEFGATLDMLLFMRVLGLRTKAVHTAAQHASRERDAMRSLAHTDPLTGLLNRRGLHSQLSTELPHCSAQRALAVFLLDLDGFKPVNDRYGHHTGDELLAAVARRLRASVRAGDQVARVGGDEFVVMTTGLHHDDEARKLGTHLLDAFDEPFELSQHRCSVGLTIGYVLAPLDSRDPTTLLKLADAAMYAGKQSGKRCLKRGGAAAPQAAVPAAVDLHGLPIAQAGDS